MTKTIQRDFDLNCLLYPAEAFRRPTDVLEDADLTLSEKRAILASWASDACAVEGTPELRRWAGASPVSFDDVMDALKKLDGAEVEKPAYGKLMTRAQRLKAIFGPETKPPHMGTAVRLGLTRRRGARRGPGPNHSPPSV